MTKDMHYLTHREIGGVMTTYAQHGSFYQIEPPSTENVCSFVTLLK